MTPPFVSYTTFNRLGLTARNLNSLLSNTTDDFELHIIDNNSQDGTWDYVQTLTDSRIKSKTRFEINFGPIYSVNFNLARRRPDQYFIVIEGDVHQYAPDWISRFMRVFEAFPEVGLLGMSRPSPYPPFLPEVSLQERNGVNYLQLARTEVNGTLDFIPGQCQMLRPELISMLGYWCEECGYGDAELSLRTNNYTPYKAGFVIDVPTDMEQSVPCEGCQASPWCRFDKVSYKCQDVWASKHKNEGFVAANGWKYNAYFNELSQGLRTAYCASIHDPASISTHLYHMDWALENFAYYIINAN
ncbi:Glycosyl transferase family 2 [Sporobacter termitidis DSM 10068]|uniref:Glycosyl transferase family 2 n=1 Tax=Sporobacter termitidis DSM 10068 TaxID=1123282 RepID=A0A1M5Z141_9FIRM|nr:glycosyltransferase family 2 protein [Sporobacter termitidis]SHI17921.1 Glycosyl transferase family 2 [Sporobacter termitidis DSM 10068]